MLKVLRFAAIAPLFILAACGDDEPSNDAGMNPQADATVVPDGGIPPDGGGDTDVGVRPDGGDAGFPDAQGPQSIIFLHTNDEHSHHIGFGPEIDDFPLPAATTNTEIVGGVKRRTKVLVDLRNEAAIARVPVVTVGAGDLMMGSLFHIGNALGGTDYILAESAMNYDVLTLGNHELDFGVGTLDTALRLGGLVPTTMQPDIFHVPVVVSNIHFSNTSAADNVLAMLYSEEGDPDHPLRRYHIEDFDGVSVGFVGVMGLDAALVAPFKSPLKFSLARTNQACTTDSDCPGSVCLAPSADPTAADGQCAVRNPENDFATHLPAMIQDIAETVRVLRERNVDIVVAVSHAGVDETEISALTMMGMGLENAARSEEILLARGVDQYLAADNVKGIDLIVGGHSHTPLTAPLAIPNEASGITTFIVQAGEYGKFVGKVRLDRTGPDANWTLDTDYSSLVTIDASIAPTGLPFIAGQVIDTVINLVMDGLEGSVISEAGDELIYPGEQCDGTFLPNMGNCSPLVPGATGGTLSCITTANGGPGDRQLDLSACTFAHPSCGDGAADGQEMCDGPALNGESCETLGYESGTLGCNANCTYSFAACQSYFPSLAEVALNFGQTGFSIKNDRLVRGDLFFYHLGRTDFDVPRPTPFHESNLMNLATDAARYTVNRLDTQSQQDPVRVSINANGVLRDAIQEGQTGVLTLEDLFRVLPLGVSPVENTPGYPLVDFYANAIELKSALEVGVNQGLLSDSFWLGVSGARIFYDPSLPAFDPANPTGTGRITKVELTSQKQDAWDDASYDGTPLFDASLGAFPLSYPDPTRLVHISTNLYIAIFAEALGVCPRTANGSQLDECRSCMGDGDCPLEGTSCGAAGRCTGGNPAAFRVRSQTPIGRFGLFQEIKEFLALTTYVRNLPDNGALPDNYNQPVPRRLCCVGASCAPDRVCN